MLFYGIIYVFADLSRTVNFDSAAVAVAARTTQILYFTPCIVIGTALLAMLVAYYILHKKGLFTKAGKAYFATVISFAAPFLIATTVISFYLKEIACLLYIILAFILLFCGIYSICKKRTYRQFKLLILFKLKPVPIRCFDTVLTAPFGLARPDRQAGVLN